MLSLFKFRTYTTKIRTNKLKAQQGIKATVSSFPELKNNPLPRIRLFRAIQITIDDDTIAKIAIVTTLNCYIMQRIWPTFINLVYYFQWEEAWYEILLHKWNRLILTMVLEKTMFIWSKNSIMMDWKFTKRFRDERYRLQILFQN